ncbi:MAG: hypothetical protein ABSH06_22570 [Thermodesulfobacteriota bacterium]
MNTLVIIRSGLANAWISGLFVALDGATKGKQVGVLFSEEALKVLNGEPFFWSPLLRDKETMNTMAKNAAGGTINFQSSRDRRQIDLWRLVKGAQGKGVQFYACSSWSKLLGMDKFPEGMQVLSQEELSQTMDNATRIWSF